MPVDPAAEQRIRDDLAHLSEHGNALSDAVFERWFAVAPDVKRLFQVHSLTNRREMVDATLVAVYDLLERSSWLKWDLAAYGGRHAGAYEVESSMYGSYVTALLESLRLVLGPERFDADHEAAWRRVLERVCAAMTSWNRIDDIGVLLAR